MAFIPALNTAKVTVWQQAMLQLICNNFHVQRSTPWDEASLIALGAEFVDGWNAHIAPLQVDDVQYQHVTVRDMTTAEGLGIVAGFPALSGGDRPGDNMPLHNAIACKLITNFSGKNRRGRIFLSGFESDQVSDQRLTDVAHAQVETNVRSLVQQINEGEWEVVVASYFDGMSLELNARGETVWTPQPRATALLTPVTNVVVNKDIDSMRRRLTGRGN